MIYTSAITWLIALTIKEENIGSINLLTYPANHLIISNVLREAHF